MIAAATSPASRGRSSGRGARQLRARAVRGRFAPPASSRLQASARSAPNAQPLDLGGISSQVRRFAGQDLAEDASQAEHVGPFIKPVEFTTSLLGGHVGGSAQDATQPGEPWR